MGAARALVVLATFAMVFACDKGGHGAAKPAAPPYVLSASGGVYDDGSGLRGVTILATLRDEAGVGPGSTWTGALDDGTGPRANADYSDGALGSYAALWWPELAFASGAWELSLASGESRAQVSLALADGAGLSPPLVSLAAGGGSLAWDAVAGAAAYECRVAFSGSTVRAETAATPGCAVGDLQDGGYAARITAFSADLGAVGADLAQSPALPTRFDMSEGRLSFLRAGADPVTVVTAAGGAMDAGLGSRTLAIWLSIRRDGGAPTPEAWTITVTGPDLPPSSPIVFTYPANFSQLLRWSYDQPATIGRYTLVATSAAGTVEAEFSVGLPAELSLPAGVTATDGAQGSARVDWTPVAGARSYLVGVWQGAEFVTSQWVAAPPANFPQDTFVAGQLYDVYVAASDADMVSGARSTQVAVVENTLQPAGFVAR